MANILITFVCGLLGGSLAKKCKMPGGMLVGALFVTAILNITYPAAYVPRQMRLSAQILAGAFSACNITKKNIKNMPRVIRPILWVMGAFLVNNLVVGFLIYKVSKLDLPTCLFAMIPGSLQNTPLISADYGANVPSVAVMQLVRLLLGLSVFPSLIRWLAKKRNNTQTVERPHLEQDAASISKSSVPNAILTGCTAFLCGLLGDYIRFPGGGLIFATIGVMILNILTNRAFLPKILKQFAQIVCGCYIGALIGAEELKQLSSLVLPALLVALSYSFVCLFIGNVLNTKFGYSISEGMLMSTPAGASDVLLVAADIGVESSDLLVVHIARMISAIVLFPPLLGWIARMLQ